MTLSKMAVRKVKRAVPRAAKNGVNIKKQTTNSDDKLLVVAQEIKFAKILAGNDKRSRDKILKHLRKWLTYRSSSTYDFTEQDFIRLWKGLFYCVWMSDKPLVQEELCENISKLYECFGTDKFETSVLFYKCFLQTMATDWFGIDQHRLDKFLMFVRRMTRGILRALKEQKWSIKCITSLEEGLTKNEGIFAPNHPKLCLGLQMHLVDCWMEEVAKVSEGEVSPKVVVALCKPFAQFVSYGEETRLSSSITRNIFIHLTRQTDVGIEYQERLHAWKVAGFPGGSVDAMQRVEDEENDEDDVDENEEVHSDKTKKTGLDPRAGHVDTELPQLPVDGRMFSAMLRKLMTDNRTTKGNRDKLRNMAESFETLASGEYPYKMKNVVLDSDPKYKIPSSQKTALDLLDFEEKLKFDFEDENLKGLSKRQRRKYLMKQKKLLEAGLLSDDDDDEDIDELAEEPPKKGPPPAKKAKKKTEKVDSGIWTVENIKGDQAARPASNIAKANKRESNKDTTQTKSPNGTTQVKNKNTSLKGLKKSPKNKISFKENVSLKNTSMQVNGEDFKLKNSPKGILADKTAETSKTKKNVKKTLLQSLPTTNSTPVISKKNNSQSNAVSSDISLEKSTPAKKNKTQINKSLDNDQSFKSSTPIVSKDLTSKKNITNKNESPRQITKSGKKESPKKVTSDADNVTKTKGAKNDSKGNVSLNDSVKSPTKNFKIATKKTPLKNNTSTTSTPIQSKGKNDSQANISLNNSTSSQKKVMIALKKNTAQGVMDYFKSVKQSPEIPFDGERKPLKTSLKPNAMPSPINPFYKKKLKLNF